MGCLDPYRAVEDFDGQVLMFPSEPTSSARVVNWRDNAMLLDDNMITWNGNECDKIGVSYTAFRYQSEACSRPVGSCLGYQPEHYHKGGKHFVKDIVGQDAFTFAPGKSPSEITFSVASEMTRTSLVTLTIATDNIQFVINRADGHFEWCNATNFESFTKLGRMQCGVQSDGKVEAAFRVSVSNCSNGILPILGEQFTLDVGQKMVRTFEIHATNPDASEHTCRVLLFDSLEDLLDFKDVTFISYEVEIDKGAQEGDSPHGEGSSISGNAQRYACHKNCDSIFDIMCLFMHGCWDTIGMLIGIVIAILIFLPCLVKLTKSRMTAAADAASTSSPRRRRRNDEQGTTPIVIHSPDSKRHRRKKRRHKRSKKKKSKSKHKKSKSHSPSKRKHEKRHRSKNRGGTQHSNQNQGGYVMLGQQSMSPMAYSMPHYPY